MSNQGAYAKGKTTLVSLWGAHLRVVELLAAHGIGFDDCFYSYTHPDSSVPHVSGPSLERKPSPYFLLVAAARHDLDLEHSWMIGDHDSDIACGRPAGTRTIFVRNPHARGQSGAGADAAAGDLQEAAGILDGRLICAWGEAAQQARPSVLVSMRAPIQRLPTQAMRSLANVRMLPVMERHIGGGPTRTSILQRRGGDPADGARAPQASATIRMGAATSFRSNDA